MTVWTLPVLNITANTNNWGPTTFIQQSHQILHLDKHLQPVTNEFQPFTLDNWTDYTSSLLPVPIICASLGALAIVILQVVLILRIFYKDLRFIPEIKVTGRKSMTLIKYAIDPRYIFVFKLFIIGTILVLDEILVVGSSFLSTGVHNAKSEITSLSNNITVLINEGNYLNAAGLTLQQELYNASSISTCSQALGLANGVETYFDPEISGYLDLINPLPRKCTDANNNMQKWGVDYKNSSVWVIYAMYIVVITLFILGMKVKNQMVCRIAVGIAELFILILFVLIAVEMVLVVS
jgi:hypothetical protein